MVLVRLYEYTLNGQNNFLVVPRRGSFSSPTSEETGVLLGFLEKQNALLLPLFFFFSPSFFWNNREFGARKYFTDHLTI